MAAKCGLSRCPQKFQSGVATAMTAVEIRAVKRHRDTQARYTDRRKDDPVWLANRRRVQNAAARKYKASERGRRRCRQAQKRYCERHPGRVAASKKRYDSRPDIKAAKRLYDRERRAIAELHLMDILWAREKRARASKERQAVGMLPEMLLMAILWRRERKARKTLYFRVRRLALRRREIQMEDFGYALAD